MMASTESPVPPVGSVFPSDRLTEVMLATHGSWATLCCRVLVTPTVPFRDTPTRSIPRLMRSLRVRGLRSRRMPGEPLDASDDLPKESRRQVALGQLQDEDSQH